MQNYKRLILYKSINGLIGLENKEEYINKGCKIYRVRIELYVIHGYAWLCDIVL